MGLKGKIQVFVKYIVGYQRQVPIKGAWPWKLERWICKVLNRFGLMRVWILRKINSSNTEPGLLLS